MTIDSPLILVVDDDAAICRVLRRCFEAEGWRVLEAATGEQLFKALEKHEVDLVTLDLGLGGENGLDIARRLRAESDIGIVMVSGRGDMIDTIVGLEIGADDYIAKPFELRIVVARIRAILRRLREAPVKRHSAQGADDVPHYRFGGCELHPGRRTLSSGQNTISGAELTSAEFDLLEVFVGNAQQVLSRDRLMDLLKGQDWHPSDRTIDNQVARLRRKLVHHGLVDVIRTVRGVGYLFAADVERIGGGTSDH